MDKNEKKLILFMPSMEGGGVEKNIIIIANYLAKNINHISLITFDKKFNKKFNNKINIINSNYSTKKKYSKYFKYFISLYLLFREIMSNRKALVFCFQANMYCIILSKIFNFDIIVRSNSSPSGWGSNHFKNLIFKILFKIPKFVIVNSYTFKKELDKKFNISSKAIYNPLNKTEILKKSKKKINFKFFDKKDLKLINIARFTDQKDHITLLKAINKIKNKLKIKLLIIGYGSNKKIIKEYIYENNLKKIVKVINFQDNPYKYLNLADCLLLTSLFEGLPNVILEALCLKKFVISSDCPTGPKEILSNEKFGFLFKMKDYNELSSLILKYSKNKKFFKKKTIKGFESLNRFDYKNNCEKYLKVIEKSLRINK